MAGFTEFLVSPPAAAPVRGSREDCWTEEATSTLVDAWGRRYLELSRGSLRLKDWKEVADAVNRRHGGRERGRRTEVQCKNRIDTLKKKYKIEKARVEDGTLMSSWRFFSRLELLIGSNVNKLTPPRPMVVPLAYRKPRTPAMATPVVLPQKREHKQVAVEESYFRRNYSAIAAAAAANENDLYAEEEGEWEGEEEEGSEDRVVEEEEEEGEEVVRGLAMAIERFGEIYENVESMKQRQMMELEKQRMQFAKDLEVQRMRLFMDTQLHLEKVKQGKGSRSSHDIYS